MASRFEETFGTRVLPAAARAFGVSVYLIRGGKYITADFTARRHVQEHISVGDYGSETKIITRDYFLPVASLLIDADAIEPQIGDRIVEGDEVFEIQPPDRDTPAFELTPGGYDWLVRTKKTT